MAYIKNTWTQNDLITADKLNNIEEGVYQSNNFITEIDLTDCFGQFIENGSCTKIITEDEALKYNNSILLKAKIAADGIGFGTFTDAVLIKIGSMEIDNKVTCGFSVVIAPFSFYFFAIQIYYNTETSQYELHLINPNS